MRGDEHRLRDGRAIAPETRDGAGRVAIEEPGAALEAERGRGARRDRCVTCVSAAAGPPAFAGPTGALDPGGAARATASAPMASARQAALSLAPRQPGADLPLPRRAARSRRASPSSRRPRPRPPSRSTWARSASLRASHARHRGGGEPSRGGGGPAVAGGDRTSLPQSSSGPALPPGSSGVARIAPLRAARLGGVAAHHDRPPGPRAATAGDRTATRSEATCASVAPASSTRTPRSMRNARREPVSPSPSAASIRRVGASGMRSSSAMAACARARATCGPTATCGE